MKNFLTQALAVAFALTALASCKKDENKVTVQPSAALTLTGSANSVVLAQINDPQTAVTYTWNPVQFSLNGTESTTTPAVSYQLQVAKTADGFGYLSPNIFDAGTSTTKSITVEDLNKALNSIGITTGSPVQAFMRVAAVIGDDNHTFVSAPVAFTVTAYPACLAPNTDNWALVGPAGNGWPSGTPVTEDGLAMKWNCALKAYTIRTALKAGPMKFRQNKAWTVNLGGPSTGLATGVSLTPGGADINIPTAGTYTVQLAVTGSGAAVTGGMLTVTP